MKALSLKPPWAWLIVHGIKPIENRRWKTNFRGPVMIHQSKTFDYDGLKWIEANIEELIPDYMEFIHHTTVARLYSPGMIIGQVEITDCVTQHDSPWFFGPYGFVLTNPQEYEKPIPCKGRLGFFEPDINKPDRID